MNKNALASQPDMRSDLKFVYTQFQRVGMDSFKGTDSQGEIAKLAINSFGFLLASVALKRFTLKQFADEIAQRYDVTNPRTAEVVRVLREIHDNNERLLKQADAQTQAEVAA